MSLSGLSEARPDLRYEIKMMAQASAYPIVKMKMLLDEAGVRTLYPPRRVQSIYFDSLDQAALHENLAGLSHREKLRFRWYGEDALGVRGKLEIKVRHNQLGWKHVVEVPNSVDVDGADRHSLRRAIFAELPADWGFVLSLGVMPVQWIAYSREYYATADGSVRITFDRQLRMCDQRHRRQISRAFPTPIPDALIVEAKCAKQAYPEAKRLLDRFPLFVDKCSKFVLASQPGEGAAVSIV